ncbi:DUF5915 domain-containing protein, partial [bacterium]|nr:DUF5915 domain-containing protein [bacterium]
RSRDRFKSGNKKDKQSALQTISYVLAQSSKVMAPFLPFISEQVWQKVTGYNFKDMNKSVHLEEWPKAEEVDKNIIMEMEATRKIVELALAKRDEKGIKVRQPLNQFSIFNFQFSNEEYMELVKDEINVKNIETVAGKGELKIELDTEITPELRQEGVKRELVRFVNGLRKKSGLTISDRVEIFFKSESREIGEVIKKYRGDLLKDTLADSVEIVKSEDIEDSKKIKINNEEIILAIKKK